MKKVSKNILLTLLIFLSVFFLIKFFIKIVDSLGCKFEELTVAKYFQAMKFKDKDMLVSMAVEPKSFEFKSYKIVSNNGPLNTELKLPKLLKELEEIKKKVRKDGVEDAAILSRVKEIKQNIKIEKNLIRFSTGIDQNLEMCTGETWTFKIVVEVEVDGKVKNYLFRLRRDYIKLQGKERLGRFIITKIFLAE